MWKFPIRSWHMQHFVWMSNFRHFPWHTCLLHSRMQTKGWWIMEKMDNKRRQNLQHTKWDVWQMNSPCLIWSLVFCLALFASSISSVLFFSINNLAFCFSDILPPVLLPADEEADKVLLVRFKSDFFSSTLSFGETISIAAFNSKRDACISLLLTCEMRRMSSPSSSASPNPMAWRYSIDDGQGSSRDATLASLIWRYLGSEALIGSMRFFKRIRSVLSYQKRKDRERILWKEACGREGGIPATNILR